MFRHLTMADMARIAKVYDAAPRYQRDALQGWYVLGRIAKQRRLTTELTGLAIIEVAVGEPYATTDEMFADIANERRLKVSTAHCDHPEWDRETNVAFRVWHDMCHYTERAGFDLAGELAACSRQMDELREHPTCTAKVGLALYTECIGQLAFALTNGYFAQQKVAYLGSPA